MSDVTANRRKGAEVRDEHGNLVCRLARDVQRYHLVRLDDFTDWQIPEPDPEGPIPAVIAKFAGAAR